MEKEVGRSPSGRATRPADQAPAGLGDTASVPNADELLIQRVILAIGSASVPHEHWMPGALSSRSLSYYLGVGIDHYRHDFDRHERLLRKAAEQAIAAIRQSERTGA